MHAVTRKFGRESFALDLRESKTKNVIDSFGPMQERAIGVIYRPQTEILSHYFRADLTRQFDISVWFDKSTALVPLEEWGGLRTKEEPELVPSGL